MSGICFVLKTGLPGKSGSYTQGNCEKITKTLIEA